MSLRTGARLVGVTLLPMLGSACPGGDCTTIAVPDIVVFVMDSVSGLPAAAGVVGRIQEGNYQDPFRPHSSRGVPPNDTLLSLQAGSERGGRYLVTLDKPGYAHWETSNVRVRNGDCHVETATLTARLRPLP